jgi:hypothetical protein
VQEQTSIYVARGWLIESTNPTWLYGTASEHAIYYQYNFNNAKNIFAGMIQTEAPYFQTNPAPPFPFEGAVGALPGDPSYSKCPSSDEKLGCDEAWGVIIRNSSDVSIYGAGLYSWYDNYTQDCGEFYKARNPLYYCSTNAGR